MEMNAMTINALDNNLMNATLFDVSNDDSDIKIVRLSPPIATFLIELIISD